MDSLIRETRHALRQLRSARGFAIVAVLCLALGIGANSAVFTIVNAIMLRPFPFTDPDRVLSLTSTRPRHGLDGESLSLQELQEWRGAGAPVFADVEASFGRSFTISGDGEPQRLGGSQVTSGMFDMLGIRPQLGRTFRADEEGAGAPKAVILSDGLWRSRYAANPNVIGRTLVVSGAPRTIVGVMPRGFAFPGNDELWVPIDIDPRTSSRGDRFLRAYVRLKPGVTMPVAQQRLDEAAARAARSYPATDAGVGAHLRSMREELIDKPSRELTVLMEGAVAFVLLIACINVANLLLARGMSRRRELAVRTALGAERWQIVRQLLVESTILALAGGIIGIGLGLWIRDALLGLIPSDHPLPYWLDFSLDTRVVVFTLLVALATGIVFGLVPALQTSRLDLQGSLKEGGRGSTAGPHRSRLRGALVVGEMALALVLLVSASLLIKSFMRMVNENPGIDTSRFLTFAITLPAERYATPLARANAIARIEEQVAGVPGVTDVASMGALPVDQETDATPIDLASHPVAPGEEPQVEWRLAGPTYFQTLRIPLLAGRAFTLREATDSLPVAIVSATMARRFWPRESAVGQRLRVAGDSTNPWLTVVGVVPDAKLTIDMPMQAAQLYVTYPMLPWRTVYLAVRTNGTPGGLVAGVRGAVRAVDRDVPLSDIWTMETVRRRSVWPQRFFGAVFGGFAALALLLACAGVYGVMSYGVSQRTHEVGLRLALGAQRGRVIGMILGESGRLAALGAALGLLLAFVVSRLLADFLYGVSTFDPVVFCGVALALGAVALAASLVPAWRASRLDPLAALRDG